jgi:lipopolysaccharide transport system permease protein
MNKAVMPAARNATLDLYAVMSMGVRHRLAVLDVRDGLRLWRLAWTLGWLDIRLRYRGSMLGPLWLTISTGVMVAALGFLYSQLFKMDLRSYLPFLALSQVLWAYLNTLVSDSCTAFTEAEGVIRSVRMPFFVFSMRILIRNLLVLAHNILVIVVVFAWYSLWPGWGTFMMIPGLMVWVVDALAITFILGGFCARFRDVAPIVGSIMQIGFFVTPVIWKPEQLKDGAMLLPINPFYDLLEIIRGPLLGTDVSALTWMATAGYSVVLCAVAWAFFVRTRGRLAFWM